MNIVVGGWVTFNAFERLEPSAGKLARWVLRGRNCSNVVLLLDKDKAMTKKFSKDDAVAVFEEDRKQFK